MGDKRTIYTIATAHLDTSWLWRLEQTIDEYIPDTLKRNFEFFEKYPEYKFNFEGSIRYEFIKEYYPDKYDELKKYVALGKWHPCGACYENGDVNIPSPEALTRNILYGKDFFRKEFGVESEDIFLPDCFGFGKTLPTVAAHSSVKGFSTGKLMWGSSVEIPFDIGKWRGIDGSMLWSAIMPFAYTTAFKNVRKNKRINEKLDRSKNNGLPEFTFVYHGCGDRGGSPHKSSVKDAIKAQRTNSTDSTDVFSVTTKEFFDRLDCLDAGTQKLLPEYDGEFLLTAHGVGSYTSRTVTKRWNRRCELLADAAERFASAAFASGLAPYPQYGLDNAWKKVIAHHFHDDITGTSFEECYERTHNDYIQAMNTFSAEYTAAVKAFSSQFDTSFVKGIPVIVSNPVQTEESRKEAVSVKVDTIFSHISVYDSSARIVPCQIKSVSEKETEIVFIAEVPSNGLAVFDLRNEEAPAVETGLRASLNSLENNFIKVEIDNKGNICSIFDKTIQKELLSAPVTYQILNNVHSFDWPAWEIKYEDCISKPYTSPGAPDIRIIDEGPALASLEIVRYAGKTAFRQTVSLDCYSNVVKVSNETDWREEASLLKASFSFTSKNKFADYDTGLGATKRPTNTEKLYEVPAQKWADITDEDASYGVAVFSDSRTGWDKPDDSTLRLTVVHTPMISYRWECSQHLMDMGLNRYSFGIMGHNGGCEEVTQSADFFCQPMHTFITDRHSGSNPGNYSFARLSDNRVRISAIKKALNSDMIVFRVVESSGNNINSVTAEFSLPISRCYEINGDETVVKELSVSDSRLTFDIGHNSIKSFAIEFSSAVTVPSDTKPISLAFNAVGITKDGEASLSTLKNSVSVPEELLPDDFIFAGASFAFSRDKLNCLIADGSKITVPSGYTTLHLLCTSVNGDKLVSFKTGSDEAMRYIPDCTEALGHWDMMQQKKTGYIKEIPQAITFSHHHNDKGNAVAQQLYLFDIAIPIDTSGEITLPDDNDIIIYAATAVNDGISIKKGSPHFDSLKKRDFDYDFSDYARKQMEPNRLEKILDRFIDRKFGINFKIGDFYNKYAFNELYYILRSLNTRMHYKKLTEKLLSSRKNTK